MTRTTPGRWPTRRSHPELWERPGDRRGHLPQRRNPLPMNGGPGGLDAVYGRERRRRSQAGGGGGFLERNGVFVPLQGTSAQDPLQGGYGFCDWTDGGLTPHPGVDLNAGGSCGADEGNAVVASVDGVVLAVLPWDQVTPGEGNHLWVAYDAPFLPGPTWAHFDHLGEFAVEEGMRFAAGELLGTCSASGGWDCAHSHCELLRSAPPSWWLWPYGWSMAQVQGVYYDPGVWYQQVVALAGGAEDSMRTDTTPEERAAVKPYFEQLGYECNMDTALMQRAALAYYRDESRGPACSYEYPAVAPDGSQVTRQKFSAGILEAKQQADGSWWTGFVEVVTHPEAIT